MHPAQASLLLVLLAGCAASPRPTETPRTTTPAPVPDATHPASAPLAFQAVPLPGASAPATLDYLAYEREPSRVWVPVGTTGSVDVFDIRTSTFARVDSFRTAQREVRGQSRTMGPSAVAIGDHAAYIGDRASSEVCAIDTGSLKLGACVTLASPTDGVAYVPTAKEVWVTTPHDQSLVVLSVADALHPKQETSIHLDGAPEGYAVDPKRGLFYTNLEDKNQTVVIDIARHAPIASWPLPCGEAGPRGVTVDAGERALVFVACTDRVLVLDGLHGGATLASIDTGAGVDNIDWLPSRRLLYAAAGKAATLTVAHVDPDGKVTPVAVGPSTQGARNGVVDDSGNAYVADPVNARLLVFPAPR